jgi:spore coat polysaccharide biosynthesis protein SpsF
MAEPMKCRIGMVLQARMGSARLPGKVLMPLGGTTLMGWIVQRLRDLPWPLVVATSDQVQDDAIVRYCEQMDVQYFRGSEPDVLDRYYQCAVICGFSHVIRLTGDNPCPDTEALQQLVALHLSSALDYTHSFGELPVGMGAEIFTFEAIRDSWRQGSAAHHREHVNEFIIEHPERFKIGKLEVALAKHAPDLRLTIDTQEDYQRISSCLSGGVDVHSGAEALIKRCSSFA